MVARKSLPALALSFLAGAGIAWVLAKGTTGSERSAGEPTTPPGTSASPLTEGHETPEAALEAIELRLERIESSLAELVSADRATSGRARVAVAGSAGPDDEELAELVRVLRGEVRELATVIQEEGRRDRVSRIQDMRAERPDADWNALQTILDLWVSNEEAARKEVQLISEVEALERYGSPDLTYGDGEDVHWVYGQGYEPETESYRLQIVLRFQDGTVTSMWVEGD